MVSPGFSSKPLEVLRRGVQKTGNSNHLATRQKKKKDWTNAM